jgi:UbiD family decarboxylase
MNLRSYIELLSSRRRLLRVADEVECHLAVGEITRSCGTPVLFENLKGYQGWRLFTNGLCEHSLIGLALGLPPEATHGDITRAFRDRISSPVQPCMVEDGPVYENINTNTANLATLPVPHWHPRDGRRYLGTWHLNITRDPENGSRNVGIYRMQLLSPTLATVSTSPNSHLGRHVAKARRMGVPLPMAVAIGVGETAIMAAASGSSSADEFEMAGGLSGKPLQLLKCKTIGLEVPADSEIVVEGFIQTDRRAQDGPYFDYTGTTNTNPHAFVFEVTGLMYRNDPIFRGASIGEPGAEDHQLFAALADVDLVDFHGLRIKQKLQSFALRERWFRTFQLMGRLGNPLS